MLFSVVTPSYRQLPLLRCCIASVADQENCQAEHLIQDAGTPGIELLVMECRKAFASPSKRIVLTVESDKGMYDAVNRGLARATGDICSYLNCDEQYFPGTLHKVGAFFEENPKIDMLLGDAVIVDKKGNPMAYRRAVTPGFELSAGCAANVLTCSMFFRRTLLSGKPPFETSWKIIGDIVWIEQLRRAGVRIAALPTPLSAFMLAGNNLSGDAAAETESKLWRSTLPPILPLQKTLAKLSLGLRKALVGCYAKHSFEYALYQKPDKRSSFRAHSLSQKWPKTPIPS